MRRCNTITKVRHYEHVHEPPLGVTNASQIVRPRLKIILIRKIALENLFPTNNLL